MTKFHDAGSVLMDRSGKITARRNRRGRTLPSGAESELRQGAEAGSASDPLSPIVKGSGSDRNRPHLPAQDVEEIAVIVRPEDDGRPSGFDEAGSRMFSSFAFFVQHIQSAVLIPLASSSAEWTSNGCEPRCCPTPDYRRESR